MATTFFIRTTNKTGFATLFARVQRPERKIDIKQSSTIQIDIQRWKSAQKSAKSMSNFLQENPQLSEIIRRLEKPCVRDPRSPSAVDPRKQV